ncbi:DUF6894 family protein [Bradyrhizobium sp.]|jgi:uncharacterized protein DUF6894|uniref:DUF6894 family protein n=1 Tax=Bradyrhizobium sp. TaxID=376 RepID=UPI002D3B441F|nr:hypothetical protein [Bradyrhizobium sp.]HZR73911.1 hypothetical protein [Bradyrhizobium sp.]
MPHFHFDIEEAGRITHDDDGQDFVDLKAARKEAVETGASIAREAFMAGSSDHVVIDVREDHAPSLKISIRLDVENTAGFRR